MVSSLPGGGRAGGSKGSLGAALVLGLDDSPASPVAVNVAFISDPGWQ